MLLIWKLTFRHVHVFFMKSRIFWSRYGKLNHLNTYRSLLSVANRNCFRFGEKHNFALNLIHCHRNCCCSVYFGNDTRSCVFELSGWVILHGSTLTKMTRFCFMSMHAPFVTRLNSSTGEHCKDRITIATRGGHTCYWFENWHLGMFMFFLWNHAFSEVGMAN